MEKKEPLKFEELRVLGAAETIADGIWKLIQGWDPFPREIVGGQLAQAADSTGANIAESFGRFHYGEKLQFLYYARGLISSGQHEDFNSQLSDLARQLNAFASRLKFQRGGSSAHLKSVYESPEDYETTIDEQQTLLTVEDLQWLGEINNAG